MVCILQSCDCLISASCAKCPVAHTNLVLFNVLQEYVFPDVTDREFLLSVHRQADRAKLSIDHYNKLRDMIAEAEYDLRRLRDPLQLHLPVEYLKKISQQDPELTKIC